MARISRKAKKVNALYCVDPSMPQGWADAFQAVIGAQDGLAGVPSLEAAASDTTQTKVVLAVLDPVVLLASQLEASDDASGAFDAWAASLDALLKHQRRMRRRVSLLDVSALYDDAAGALDGVAARLEVPLAPVSDLPQRPALPTAFFRVAAKALVDAAPEIADKVAELRASTIGAQGDAVPAPDVTAAVQAWRDLTTQDALLREGLDAMLKSQEETARAHQMSTGRLAEASVETDLLKENLDLLLKSSVESQAQNRQLSSNLEEAVTNLAKKDQELQEKSAALSALQANLEKAQTEISDLRQNLRAMGDDAEKQAQSSRSMMLPLTEELDLLRESLTTQLLEHEARQEEIALLRTTVQQQLDAAADQDAKLSTLMAEAVALRETTADYHVLKATKDALQRRLDDAARLRRNREAILGSALLADLKTQEAQTKSLAEQQASAARDLEEARGETLQARKELDDLKGFTGALEAELTRVYGSKSWKVTGPLRAARSKFGSTPS